MQLKFPDSFNAETNGINILFNLVCQIDAHQFFYHFRLTRRVFYVTRQVS